MTAEIKGWGVGGISRLKNVYFFVKNHGIGVPVGWPASGIGKNWCKNICFYTFGWEIWFSSRKLGSKRLHRVDRGLSK